MPDPRSRRLHYRRIRPGDVAAFHALLVDDHVRQYLLDGQLLPREAAVAGVEASERLFAKCGVGLWLVAEDSGVVGYCGFRRGHDRARHPHLGYALVRRVTGRGLATEMTEALVAHAAAVGFAPLRATVDEVNAASVRVLEKAGFRHVGDDHRRVRADAALRAGENQGSTSGREPEPMGLGPPSRARNSRTRPPCPAIARGWDTLRRC